MRGLSFRIGAALYALPLRDIQQMLALPRLRPLAGAAPCVAGLLNLHGQSLAVIDLGCACGAEAIEPHRQSRIALLPAPRSASLPAPPPAPVTASSGNGQPLGEATPLPRPIRRANRPASVVIDPGLAGGFH